MNCTTLRENTAQVSVNAMGILVEEVLMEQIEHLSVRDQSYMNYLEIITYALNQLPALYATSEKGLIYQLERGRSRYRDQIKIAVQRALIAVLRDPLLTYTPLQPTVHPGLQAVLEEIGQLLNAPNLDWQMLPEIINGLMNHASAPEAIASAQEALAAKKYINRSSMTTNPADDMTVYFQFFETITTAMETESSEAGSRAAKNLTKVAAS